MILGVSNTDPLTKVKDSIDGCPYLPFMNAMIDGFPDTASFDAKQELLEALCADRLAPSCNTFGSTCFKIHAHGSSVIAKPYASYRHRSMDPGAVKRQNLGAVLLIIH